VAGIALGRDVDADGSVDVLGVQLEEMVERLKQSLANS
jgi:hypothetical protein